jgi:hypothetical protein
MGWLVSRSVLSISWLVGFLDRGVGFVSFWVGVVVPVGFFQVMSGGVFGVFVCRCSGGVFRTFRLFWWCVCGCTVVYCLAWF